jgi:hypothetical protein
MRLFPTFVLLSFAPLLQAQTSPPRSAPETVGRLEGVRAGGGKGCLVYSSDSAEAVGNLLNEIQWTVLKP